MKTRFLQILFPDLRDSFIEIRRIGTGAVKSVFYRSIQELLDAMPKSIDEKSGYNVYFGACPRNKREGSKGAIKNIHALWADMDGKDFKGGKEEALKRLNDFPLRPTAIVDSGHGYHAYWILKEDEVINNPEDIVRIESYLKRLAVILGADIQATEIARVLRLPGTYNIKDPSSPALVDIINLDESLQYNLSDFEAFLPALSTTSKGFNPPGWISQGIVDLHDGNRHCTFVKIIGRLNRDNYTPDDIFDLLAPHAERSGMTLDELREEVDDICQRYPQNTTFPSFPYNSKKTGNEFPPFQASPLATFVNSGDNQDIKWHIERLLPKEGVGILSGPAGYGKSWMLLDLAIECACGGKWLGHFTANQCRVLYLDEESSPALLRRRLKRLLKAKNLEEEEVDVHFCVGQGLCLTEPSSVERLHELIATLRPGLVIVDSLIRVHHAEENSATQMSQVFAEVKEIVREFGSSFLFADHQRKPSGFGMNLDMMLRGSSEKAAFVDTLLSLQRKNNNIIIEHSKSRCDVAVPSFAVNIIDPEPEATSVVYVGEAEELKQQIRQEAAREYIISNLPADEWVARKTLLEQAKEAGIHEKALDETLKIMTEEGLVDRENRKNKEGRGGKSAFYRLKKNSSPSQEREMEIETESDEEDINDIQKLI